MKMGWSEYLNILIYYKNVLNNGLIHFGHMLSEKKLIILILYNNAAFYI